MPRRNTGERTTAMASFKRLMIYLVVAGVLMVTAALFYLASYGKLTSVLVITVSVGVFVSIVLGGGLMAAGFFSSSSGYDEEVGDAANQAGPNDIPAAEHAPTVDEKSR